MSHPGTKGWVLSHPGLPEFVDMKALAALAPEGDEFNNVRSRLFSLDLWLNSTFKGGCQCPRKPSLHEPSTEPQFCAIYGDAKKLTEGSGPGMEPTTGEPNAKTGRLRLAFRHRPVCSL